MSSNINQVYDFIKSKISAANDLAAEIVAARSTAWEIHHAALIQMAAGAATQEDIEVVNAIRFADEETGKLLASASTEEGETFKMFFSKAKNGMWRCKPSLIGKAETVKAVEALRNPFIKYADVKIGKSEVEKAVQKLNGLRKTFGGDKPKMFIDSELQTRLMALLDAVETEITRNTTADAAYDVGSFLNLEVQRAA